MLQVTLTLIHGDMLFPKQATSLHQHPPLDNTMMVTDTAFAYKYLLSKEKVEIFWQIVRLIYKFISSNRF